MEIKACCFTGHRHLSHEERDELESVLDRYLQALCDLGCTEFRVGGALGFDTLAAQRVLALRETHPTCHLHMILPCRDQEMRWPLADRIAYRKVLERANRVTYVQEEYTQGCMYIRNRALVDGSDVVIAYLKRNGGGTAYTCRYAEKQGVRVINTYNDQLSIPFI